MLYTLKAGEVRTDIPTIGLNVKTLKIRGKLSLTTMVSWDLGGRGNMRPFWRAYFQGYENVDALVFMVDSSDLKRMKEARMELDNMLREDGLLEKPLLVFANKQDLPGALSVPEVVDKLGLHGIRNRQWYIQESVATEGKGLTDGLEWLTRELQDRSRSDRHTCEPCLPVKGPKTPEQPDDVSTADTEDAIARAEVITAHP